MKSLESSLQRALDGAWRRQGVLAGNLANAETPGYKRQDLDFLSVLKQSESRLLPLRTHPFHLSIQSKKDFIPIESGESITPDGNGVDMDKEMAEISANAIYYTAISKSLSGCLSLLRKAATEGRR